MGKNAHIKGWFFICSFCIVFCIVIGNIQVWAADTCAKEKLDNYRKIIQYGAEEYRIKEAANCLIQLPSSNETLQMLVTRLNRILEETRALKPTSTPTEQGRIAVVLAEALYKLKSMEGYRKIKNYFDSADWHTHRDQEFFDSIAAHGYNRAELTETFYLALTKIPPGSSTFGRACSVFHRMGDMLVIRDDPKFIQGVLGALSRLEQTEDTSWIKNWVKERCEETLMSQLLDKEMREKFMNAFNGKLSSEEQHILDRFTEKITPSPDVDVIKQLTTNFFSVSWKAKSSDWQKLHKEVTCEEFHGEGYVTKIDDLWCTLCTFKNDSFEMKFYFYPDSKGETCTLQKVRLSYPSTSESAIESLTKNLAERMGVETPLSKVYDFGSAYWEEISFWEWTGRKVYVFRNNHGAHTGEGLPLVEILARDKELASVIRQEERIEQLLEEEEKQREMAKKEKLYQDVAKSFPGLIQRLEKATDAESYYAILMQLLPRISTGGSERAAQLYLADILAAKLAPMILLKEINGWEEKQKELAKYEILYQPLYQEDIYYNHIFLKKIIKEGLSGYWADEAFWDWLSKGCEMELSPDVDMFLKIIAEGENFLKKKSTSHIRKYLLLLLAKAYETSCSLSMSSPKDPYVNSGEYKEHPSHRKKAISYYEDFIKEDTKNSEAILAQERLKRLRLKVDTNSREFRCIWD